jgi:single-stranded DNA-binding protein
MNICALSGIATTIYYDELLTRHGEKQPFLAFLLRLQGPRKEGNSTARIVVYGQNAKEIFPLLYEGKHVEIVGRFRNSRRHQEEQVYEFIASRVDFPPGNTITIETAKETQENYLNVLETIRVARASRSVVETNPWLQRTATTETQQPAPAFEENPNGRGK